MPKTEDETRPETKEAAKRRDTVKPPASLPDASPLERMTELTRRIVSVPRGEAVARKTRTEREGR